jgi:hypothetical protein
MSAAPTNGVITQSDVMSPELVLVDPELGLRLRTLHDSCHLAVPASEVDPQETDPPWAPVRHDTAVALALSPDEEARRRLINGSGDPEVVAQLGRATAFRRRATLIPSTSAAISVALFVFQLFLDQGRLR